MKVDESMRKAAERKSEWKRGIGKLKRTRSDIQIGNFHFYARQSQST